MKPKEFDFIQDSIEHVRQMINSFRTDVDRMRMESELVKMEVDGMTSSVDELTHMMGDLKMEWQEGDHKILCRGIEDWCFPDSDMNIRTIVGEEITIVADYPDCRLYIGVAPNGVAHGWAKVVNGKTVWVKCNKMIPKFKERFYDKFDQ